MLILLALVLEKGGKKAEYNYILFVNFSILMQKLNSHITQNYFDKIN